MARDSTDELKYEDLKIPVDRDFYLRKLVRELAGTLEDVVGPDEAAGFISVVGQRVGEFFDEQYRQELGASKLDREQVARTLVDLKRRIEGDFHIIEENDEKLVLGNRACPFGSFVEGRPSMCMMTSNVFGTVTAQNLGRAKVCLDETIAEGDPGCRITIYLKSTPEAMAAEGRDYFQAF